MPVDSQTDCNNITGWFTVLEPKSENSAIRCPWQPDTPPAPPHFLFSPENSSVNLSGLCSLLEDFVNKLLGHRPLSLL